jgi:hypothetical protein
LAAFSELVSSSFDHSEILIAGQGEPTIYDSATDSFTPIPGYQSGIYEPAMNPAGTQFALIDGLPLIQFFNTQMRLVGSTNLTVVGRPSGAVYSPDGNYLYIVLPNPLPVLVTVDTSTFQVVGTAPAYFSNIAYFSQSA